MKNSVLGNVLGHCKPPSLINRGENCQLVDFPLLNSEMAVLGQVFKYSHRDSTAANRSFRWKTVGVTNEYAKERLRTAADFRVVTPTQLHRWKQPQRGREQILQV